MEETIRTDLSITGIVPDLASKEIVNELATPFEHIALAFSGGGFRAASFALGVLSYLNEIEFAEGDSKSTLLEKVRYISSASGGTITSASFGLACAQGLSFDIFFNSLHHKLEGEGLLLRALEILNTKKEWKDTPSKTRNLINSFALAYNEILFNKEPLEALLQKSASGMKVPLEELCFNATEFARGLPFRQNTKIANDEKKDPNFLYGNFYLSLPWDAAGKIKIADALAASSCFPIGFEPLKFPDDFSNADLPANELGQALSMNASLLTKDEMSALNKNGIGIMDGGVDDNQGLESLMLADIRRIKNETDYKPFDFIMVNDVGSQYMDPYKVPKMPKGRFGQWLSYRKLQYIFFGILPFLAVIFFLIAWKSANWRVAALCLTGGDLCILLTVLFAIINAYVPGKHTSMAPLNNFSPKIISLLRRLLGRTSLFVLYRMLAARVSSTIIMNSDVFLKRIRKLIYDNFYSAERWKYKRKSNHVYDLSYKNDLNRARYKNAGTPSLNQQIQIVAETARAMGTTLWFSEDDELDLACLIACGHFTTCYNLIEYIWDLQNNETGFRVKDASYLKRLDEINAQLQDQWARFLKDPFWLYNQVLKNGTIKNETLTVKVNGKDVTAQFQISQAQ